MTVVIITKAHKIKIDAVRTRTLPVGWTGDVDDAVSREIVGAGNGSLLAKKTRKPTAKPAEE